MSFELQHWVKESSSDEAKIREHYWLLIGAYESRL
jgi:hypothetical protein